MHSVVLDQLQANVALAGFKKVENISFNRFCLKFFYTIVEYHDIYVLTTPFLVNFCKTSIANNGISLPLTSDKHHTFG